MDILNEETLLENYLDNLGIEMVHLAKFEHIPYYASKSWINSVLKGSKDFIED